MSKCYEEFSPTCKDHGRLHCHNPKCMLEWRDIMLEYIFDEFEVDPYLAERYRELKEHQS